MSYLATERSSKSRTFLLLHRIPYELCKDVSDLVENLGIPTIVCGVGQCYEVLDKNVLGINLLEDDTYVVKKLKEIDGYLPGNVVERGEMCFAGLDPLNWLQNVSRIEKLLEEMDLRCRTFVLVSQYPPRGSRCSEVSLFGRKLFMGVEIDDLLQRASKRFENVVVVSINELVPTCIDRYRDCIVVNIRREGATLVEVRSDGVELRDLA